MRIALVLGGVSAGLVALVAALAGSPLRAAETNPAGLWSAQADYLEQCGGCHGLQGDTTPAPIPVLRDRVGYFMCTKAGRDYLLRLPNIVNARVENQELAEMMNFVVFNLGGRSAQPNAPHFTPEDVARLRPHPMRGGEVVENRAAVVEGLIKTCHAPASLRVAYPGEPPPKGR